METCGAHVVRYLDLPSKSICFNAPDSAPDNSPRAADAPWELCVNAKPESGAAAEAARPDCVEACTVFLRIILSPRRFMLLDCVKNRGCVSSLGDFHTVNW